MYSVSAQVNDVSVVKVPLKLAESGSFSLDVPAINATLSADPTIKLAYICSPGNPTGELVSRSDVEAILANPDWNGVVIVDEAYIDFAPEGSSMAPVVTAHKNLVVMQTLSKAFGLAGIRLGAAFCDPEIASLLNSLKAPYSISSPTVALANAALSPEGAKVREENIAKIVQQRDRLVAELPKIPGLGRFLGGFSSNFLLIEVLDGINGKPDNIVSAKVYERLAEVKNVVVRFRGKEHGCTGCIRITVGTEDENTALLQKLKEALGEIYQ